MGAPVAPTLALPGPIPEPVEDTPEVAAAKVEFQAAYDEAAAAAAAAPDSRKKRSILTPAFAPSVASPLRFSYGFSTPLHYRTPFVYGAPTGLTYSAAYGAPLTYTAGAPAPLTYTAAAPAAVKDATLLRVVHNPGHATSYRVD